MGIGNMINRLLNNESDAEKNERLKTSIEKEIPTEAKEINSENNIEEVLSKEEEKSIPEVTKEAESGNKQNSSNPDVEVTEEKILEVLSEVYDPEIPIDIVNLGLIYGIDIQGGIVVISMTMTSPGCPASTQIAGESKLVVEEIPGVESVNIDIVWDPPWDPSKMSEEAQQSMGL
jgi:metal-sulfur cluster biosynthetic enzyme